MKCKAKDDDDADDVMSISPTKPSSDIIRKNEVLMKNGIVILEEICVHV